MCLCNFNAINHINRGQTAVVVDSTSVSSLCFCVSTQTEMGISMGTLVHSFTFISRCGVQTERRKENKETERIFRPNFHTTSG